ncbi:unnamed protein product [Protopolystoma xenopodis]|uniref:Uncharacterized protein n=1 Tax=Protopolystoma xenopodis TaxID=117903 RepID=A0A448XCF2_9PLAT|nr:unnamed protein product [Protopolystoma xenopodis]
MAALASCFPVAFLEPQFNSKNPLSITYKKSGDYSLEARDILQQLSQSLPLLEVICQEVSNMGESGLTGGGVEGGETPYLIEVTMPMLCSYLPNWWRKGPECLALPGGLSESTVKMGRREVLAATTAANIVTAAADQHQQQPATVDTGGGGAGGVAPETAVGPLTTVTAGMMNRILGSVLQLIQNNIDAPRAPWMTRIASERLQNGMELLNAFGIARTTPIVANATSDMLGRYFLPVSERLLEHALIAERVEEAYKMEKRIGSETAGAREEELLGLVEVLVRNLFAFYPLLIKFVDLHRTAWLKHPTVETERLFAAVAHMFLIWARSAKFKREEENFVHANEIDHLSLIMPSNAANAGAAGSNSTRVNQRGLALDASAGPGVVRGKRKKGTLTSLTVACIKRLLPIGLSQLGGRQQELVQRAKRRLIQVRSSPPSYTSKS